MTTINFIDCPGCWQRKIHASLRYCETCSIVAASTDNLNAALAQLKTTQDERDEQAKRIESLQAQLDLAHKFHDVAVKERDCERRTNHLLGEVLAVLNGDGGHATRELGWEKSTQRALARYYNMLARAAGCVTYPCDCTYPRDGQPDFNCSTCHGLGAVAKTEMK